MTDRPAGFYVRRWNDVPSEQCGSDDVTTVYTSKKRRLSRRSKDGEDGERECVVCMSKSATHAFVPCGHRIVCAGCSGAILSQSRQSARCVALVPRLASRFGCRVYAIYLACRCESIYLSVNLCTTVPVLTHDYTHRGHVVRPIPLSLRTHQMQCADC